jgi:SAM-dependent methyltransferase
MVKIPENILSLSSRHGFERSAKYDQAWVFDNAMGPNPLWLAEWMCRDMRLSGDMVVLDMGCGKALTSIFLAREFGCTVFANDLWVSPDENMARVTEQGLQRRVFPIHAEAHTLPYARGFFDAIICVDAYQYFGTDDTYLDYFSKFVKPGGQIGIVVAGWLKEKESPMPPGLESYPYGEFANFHTARWWREHLEGSGPVEIEACDYLPEGKRVWLDSARAMHEVKRILRSSDGTAPDVMKKELDFWQGDIDFLGKDVDDYAALIRVVMKRKSEQATFRSS